MFKYQKFADYTKKNLLNNIIYCQHYSKFNDPFECWCIENNGFPDPILDRERFLAVIRTWGFSADRQEEAIIDYQYYVETLGDEPGIVDRIKNSVRIACFSSEAENLLMWSHYADGLQGFCILFDESAFINCEREETVYIHSVNYRSTPEQIDTVAFSIANDMCWHDDDIKLAEYELNKLHEKVFATKPFQWAYECEKRITTYSETVNDDIGISLPYDSKFIRRIIVGEKVSDENVEFLLEFIKDNSLNIVLEVASREPSSFNIKIRDF